MMTMRSSPPPNSAADEWSLPAEPLRARVLLAAASGGSVVAVLAAVLHGWLATTRVQPLIAVILFGAMVAIALMMMRHHHPFPRFGPANRVTMMRAALVALAGSFMAEPAETRIAWTLVGLTITVAVLDGVDGWLARRTQMTSAFGARFDMETDAFFMLVLSVLVWRHHKAGAWVMAIGLMRYAFVAGGWFLTWLSRPLRATVRGKAIAVVTLVALGLALTPSVPVPTSTLVCALALAALAWSFAVDVRFLWNAR